MTIQMVAFFALIFAGVPAFSQMSLAPGIVLQKRIHLKFEPSYFFKVNGEGTKVAFTMFRNYSSTGEQNFLLNIDGDLGNPKKFAIPGSFDPMFNHNFRSMTIPVIHNGNYVCGFYSEQHVLRKGRDAEPKFVDQEMPCVYQSVGLLSTNSERDVFRLIVESGGGFLMRDYEENAETGRIRPISSVKPLCPGWNIKLPMISKDGREMGAYGVDRNSTMILSIADDGNCTLKEDLKVRAGKVAFSYDKKRVAYHVFNSPNTKLLTDFIEVPTDDYVSDVYILNRETGKTQRITKNTRSNSMFPEFMRDGRVMFIDHPHEGTHVKVSLGIVQPK